MSDMDRKRKKELSEKKLETTMYYGYSKSNFKERYEVEKSLKNQNDNIIRFEIHDKISSYIKEGKNKEEIISLLSKEKKYTKYFSFISSWIDDRMKKNGSFEKSFNRFV